MILTCCPLANAQDPKKREIYDRHGEQGVKEGGGERGGGMGDDLLSRLFGFPGGERGGRGPRRSPGGYFFTSLCVSCAVL